MEYLLLIRRLLFFCTYTTWIVFEIYVRKRLLGADLPALMQVRRRWAANLLKGCGVRLESQGTMPLEAGMIVANHRSYLDPILFIAGMDAVPLCKAEVRSWPVVGWGAGMSGVLFVERESPAHRTAMVRSIIQTAQQGFPVLIFPEGTTSGKNGTLPFQMGAFNIAVRCRLKVAPVVYVFRDPEDYWVGEESFLEHAWRRFRQKNIDIKVVYGPCMASEDPEQLATDVRQFMDNILMQQTSEAW